MPAKKSVRIPKYRQHRPSGRAVVRINGHDFYLGKFNSPESHAEYERLIAEWITGARRTPADISPARRGVLSINDLILAYATFADGYYRKNGIPTGEFDCIRYSLRPLRKLYGSFPIQQFGPLALKNVREEMLKTGKLCRNEINKRIGRIVRMFKWGVENELVDPMIHHALAQVKGLARGRSSARDSQPVKPVSDAHIEAVRPLVSRQVRAMIDLQRLTGMRPGEVCQMRAGDIDRSQEVWVYRPGSHKTEHHGHERKILLGPQSQEILQSWLRAAVEEYLFSPRDELAERSAMRRISRKTNVQPSQRRRVRKQSPHRAPRDHYTNASYNRAIQRACLKADIPRWHANQIRHSTATSVRREFGLDMASILLGHRGVGVTQVYAERDEARAIQVVSKIG